MDNDICSKCGLPTDLGIYDQIVKGDQRIIIRQVNVKYNKWMTTVEGINSNEINIKELTKKLKKKFCCGGTSKNGIIKLQGKYDLKQVLVKEGFFLDNIVVI
jgi:translation initiation factor 1